jgi:hypothetical protein
MRNRQDNRRDFDEDEHPRDARGRFMEDDEVGGDYGSGRYRSRGFGGGPRYGRGPGSGYGSERYGGGEQDYRGLTRGGGYGRDYSGSEAGWGYPQEGRGMGSRGGGGYRQGDDWRGHETGGEGGSWAGRGRDDDDFDPDYRHWRGEQMKQLDSDYQEWRQERRKKFSEDFDKWRSSRSKGFAESGSNK